jgi:dipeptidyl aminopeptidase/acylaminoacyl peptidase
MRGWMKGALAATLSALVFTMVPGSEATAQLRSSNEWANKVVPLEVFGQFPTLAQPRISPNGKIIAAQGRSGNMQALALIRVDVPNARPEFIASDKDFTDAKKNERSIATYRWIDDDNLLIFIRGRVNIEGEWYDDQRIAAYNLTNRKVTPLGWLDSIYSGTSLLWMSEPGAERPRIVIQRVNDQYGYETLDNPEVVEVDVKTGRDRVVVRPNPVVTSWDVDENGVVRVGSSSDRDTGKYRILYRQSANGTFRTILRDRADMHSEPAIPSIILKNGKAYGYSNKDGYRALYEYDLETMSLGKKVFGVDGYDIDGAAVTPDGNALQAYLYTDQRSRAVFVDPTLKEIQDALESGFGKGNVSIESADLKREKIIFTASELGQAPAIMLFDTATGAMRRLAYFNDTLKDAKLNPVSMIRYPASDGKSIEAVLTMPRHKAGQKNLPLIIMPHGGPWARDAADWDPYLWAQALAEYGYVVIQPNYRGSTGYGKEWGKAVDGNWGERMQDDLNDAITHLAGQGIADPKRVCMFGWSYGGYAASRAAQRDGSKYRCAISGAGVHDLPDMVAYDKDYLGAYGAKMALGAAATNLVAISPSRHAAQYSTPILIVHGVKDQRVPVAQSRDLVSRLKRAGKIEGKDFVYLEQKENTHNLLREQDRIELLTTVKKFLDQHNPA